MPFNKNLVTFTADTESFTAAGIEFFIYDEKMTFHRIKEFQAISQKIISSRSSSDNIKFKRDMYAKLRSDATPLSVIGDLQHMLFNDLKSIENRSLEQLKADHMEDYFDLCCTFIYTKDEDMAAFDPAHQDMKKAIWKTHCDGFCFFLLGMSRLPQLAAKFSGKSKAESQIKTPQTQSHTATE